MSNNKRNKEIENSDNDMDDVEDSGSDNSDCDSQGNVIGDMEIQCDFEGRNPEDCDFHGIKAFLRQLFVQSNVNLGELAQIIISQNYIGSVVKQCLDDGHNEDDGDDDEDDGSDGVFGITTVINVTKRKDEPCISQLRTLLTTLAEENADDKTKKLVQNILSDDSHNVGFVINERMINLPAAISVPLFESLESELQKAIKKNMPYVFQYLVWIIKSYNTGGESEVLFANQEERPLVAEALASFNVDVTEQVDSSDDGMSLSRKVLIFEGKKFSNLISLMKQEVEQPQ